MERVKAFFTSLYWTALSIAAVPALALAQGATTGTSPSTGGGAAPAGSPGSPSGSTAGAGDGWLWIVAALVVLAIIWWMVSVRRRGQRAV